MQSTGKCGIKSPLYLFRAPLPKWIPGIWNSPSKYFDQDEDDAGDSASKKIWKNAITIHYVNDLCITRKPLKRNNIKCQCETFPLQTHCVSTETRLKSNFGTGVQVCRYAGKTTPCIEKDYFKQDETKWNIFELQRALHWERIF